jgi:uncharacterized coiled-coil protein SlyX
MLLCYVTVQCGWAHQALIHANLLLHTLMHNINELELSVAFQSSSIARISSAFILVYWHGSVVVLRLLWQTLLAVQQQKTDMHGSSSALQFCL